MASVATGDRTATRDEVLACRGQLRDFAHRHGLLDPRVDDVGTVIVHSSEPGYGSVRRFASEASTHVGVWVNVITAEVLEMIRQLVADGRELYDRDRRQRWALERGWIFAGNLAERIGRRDGPNDIWAELIAIRNVYAHYTPGTIDASRVWFHAETDIERVLEQVRHSAR